MQTIPAEVIPTCELEIQKIFIENFEPAIAVDDSTCMLSTPDICSKLQLFFPNTFELTQTNVFNVLKRLNYKTTNLGNMNIYWLIKEL